MNKKYFFVHNLASEASHYDWSIPIIPIITTSTYSNSIHYMGSLRSPQPKLHQTMGSLRSPQPNLHQTMGSLRSPTTLHPHPRTPNKHSKRRGYRGTLVPLPLNVHSQHALIRWVIAFYQYIHMFLFHSKWKLHFNIHRLIKYFGFRFH